MAFTSVSLTGTVKLSNSTPAAGASVNLTLSTPITDGTVFVAPETISTRCAADGTFTIAVNANDDSTTQPTGTYYSVVIGYGSQTLDSFNVVVLHADSPTVNLFTLATLPNPNVVSPYVSQLTAGTGITLSPTGGTGAVQITSTGGSGAQPGLDLTGTTNAEVTSVLGGQTPAVVGQVPSNIAGGRTVVATRWLGFNASGGLGSGANNTSRVKFVIETACNDIRFVFANQLSTEAVIANEIWVKLGVELPSAPVAQLTSALSTGAPITTLPVATLPAPGIASAAVVTLTDPTGAHSQTWTMSGAGTTGVTSLPVSSQTPNFAYPAGSLITAIVIFPVTFGGLQYGVLDPYGHIISDICPLEFTAGETIYIRTYQRVPFTSGPGYLTLAATVGSGVNQITTTNFPTGILPQVVTLDQGGSAETVTVNSYSGTSNPYTLNLAANTTKAHNSGAVVGQGGFTNVSLFADYGDAGVGADDSYSGTLAGGTGLTAGTTTTTAGITAGDSKFNCVAPVAGATVTVDTAGTPETVTVRDWTGTANPYTCWITGTFANTHSSGVAVAATNNSGVGLAPTAIVADRVSGARKKPVLIVGDSIPNGTGYGLRGTNAAASYISLALEAAGYPYIQVTKAGEAIFQFVMPGASQFRRRAISLCEWAYCEYGTNDIYGGQTLAEVQANTLTVFALLKARGLKVCAQTLIPRTSSTDQFLTVTNQTILTAPFNVVRVAYNNWLRAWQTNGLQGVYVDALVDIADVVEVNAAGALTQDGGYWIADASGPYTADGVHPSYLGHTVKMEPAITPASIFV